MKNVSLGGPVLRGEMVCSYGLESQESAEWFCCSFLLILGKKWVVKPGIREHPWDMDALLRTLALCGCKMQRKMKHFLSSEILSGRDLFYKLAVSANEEFPESGKHCLSIT